MIFSIKNLACSYDGNSAVLKIDDLIIEKGKIHTILGLSGSGKSTILETLGLMNNTIVGGEVEFLNGNSSTVRYTDLWAAKNEEMIVEIRKQHFSFIFQSTNLMRNFSAYDNICLSQMIQGYSLTEARSRADLYLKKTNLHHVINNNYLKNQAQATNEQSLVSQTEKEISKLSGGERQRLAFIRAISPDYSVLLCDEPTGNLDNMNARELMNIINAQIKEENKTAVIVSHQIELAVNYSDIIILIQKGVNDLFGKIGSEHVFKKDETGTWKDFQNNTLVNIYETINNQLFNE